MIDSTNQQGEMFGAERLDDAFRRFHGDHMLSLDRLFAEIEQFRAGQQPVDDYTAIVMDFQKRLVASEGF